MTDNKVSCKVFRCSQKDEMYLYLRQDLDVESIPDGLSKMLGQLDLVMNLSLDENRKLAREDVSKVMTALSSEGYFLQLPPKQNENTGLTN